MAVFIRKRTYLFQSPPVLRCISQGCLFKAKSKSDGKGKGKRATDETLEIRSVDPNECLDHKHCFGANILRDGEDPLIKSDSDYPSWLWTLADSPVSDPNNKLYWRHKNKRSSHSNNSLMKLKTN